MRFTVFAVAVFAGLALADIPQPTISDAADIKNAIAAVARGNVLTNQDFSLQQAVAEGNSSNALSRRLLIQKAKLSPLEIAGAFGRSVALSSDGNTALLGAENAPCDTGEDCGAAYVFIHSRSGTWIEQQKLTASDTAPFYNFGHSVALSADGKTALVGAPFAGPPGIACPALSCGAGYVFVSKGGQWIQNQKLTGSDAGIGATFGWSVALSGDGKSALIGAINVPCPSGTNGCGAAYVFGRGKGDDWVEQDKLLPSDAGEGDEFGRAVSLSRNGKTALMGEFFADCPAGKDCGAAYVFARNKRGLWIEQQKLTASDEAADAAFSFSVSLSASGDAALIGAPNDFCPSGAMFCGAGYVFIGKSGGWVQQQKLTISNAAGGGVFGFSVGLAADGRTALLGDPDAECPAVGGECGAAYVFVRKGSNWVQQQKLSASDPVFADRFGAATAISGNGSAALLGTDNLSCDDCGAVYVFSK